MIGRAAIGSVDFNEIKHYFNTGEHLNRQLLIECKQYVIILWAMEWKGEQGL
jgi:hypothetical protein